ncbi:GMC family oxidoreductase [Niallia endozanthoxylica]|uniref:GMC family oxidoreductase n=1 Tax=Niallia endozanthoxylica TaxID=2036016 RepID=A0A5J5GX15_9BACI|nr:GMC family oxidoreductase [Niallia endozanthoxylica]KAA9012846.1 GMC family oxidoreductase [Niallia endozanthoxylica]
MGKENVFDYIVIGAGTAGGVIAKELTDKKSTSVLVLEAGTNMPNPSASFETANAAANDNRLSFRALSNIEDALGRPLLLWSGRVIGGSSEHNFMYAVRGSRNLYNEWADLVGDQWSYEKVRTLFKKNETYTGNTQSPKERGTDGPIFVRQQMIPSSGGIIRTLAEAASEVLDIPIVKDYNTGVRDCTFLKSQFLQQPLKEGFARSSTRSGYLNENIVTQGNEFNPDEFGVGGRDLTIFAKSTVNRILFEEKKGVQVAVGVEYVKNGVTERAYARKGVIISAGIFSSVILQRSGIGRTSDLANAGISTLVESPQVGHNFQTHYSVAMGVEVETSRLLEVLAADPDQPIAMGAFKKEEGPGRRLQLIGAPGPFFVPNADILSNNWQFNPENKTNVMSFGIIDLNPSSRGTILATHSNPEAYPSIQFNPLENSADLNYIVDKYIEMYNIIVQAREDDPKGVYKVVYPSEDIFQCTDEDLKRSRLEQFARASYNNFAHFGGQCKMGTSIQDGVVDGCLNVFGTKNLKVADLSIAPILPDGNTSTAAQMIGLNAARFLKQETPYVIEKKELKEYSDEIESQEE